MKRKFNFLRVLSTLVLTGLLLSGCGNKLQGPDVTGKALYNLLILGDSSEIEKIGMPSEDAQEMIKEEKELMVTGFASEFASLGMKLTDEKNQEFTDALIKALSKLSVTTEVVSKDGETAVVKVSTNHIDFENLCNEVADATASEVIALNLTDENEAMAKAAEKFFENITFGLNTTYPSKDTIEKEFEFKIESEESNGLTYKIWLPSDIEGFFTDITEMAMGENKK